MSSVIELKRRKKTVESFLRSNSALKSVASVRLIKYKNLLMQSNEICKILPEYIFNKVEKENQSEKILNLIIGCNQGMCGEFFSAVLMFLRVYLKKFEDDLIVMGKKFFSFSEYKKNIFFIELDLSDIGIFKIISFVYNYINDNKITKFVLYYYHNNKVEKEVVIALRNVDSFLSLHEKVYIAQIIQRALYRSALSENKERIINLEQANTNAEAMQKKIVHYLNRLRQEKITNSLNEIISGVLI